MPRRSIAELSTVRIPGERLPPPEQLSTAVAAIFERITASLPAERVADAGFQLLATHLCQHIHFAEHLGNRADELIAEPDALDDAHKRHVLRSVLRSHADQTTAIGVLSTKLRPTPQSRYVPDKAALNRPTGVKPWDDWSNDATRRTS